MGGLYTHIGKPERLRVITPTEVVNHALGKHSRESSPKWDSYTLCDRNTRFPTYHDGQLITGLLSRFLTIYQSRSAGRLAETRLTPTLANLSPHGVIKPCILTDQGSRIWKYSCGYNDLITLPVLIPQALDNSAVVKMAGIPGVIEFRTSPTSGGFDIACGPVTKTICTFLRYTSLQSYGSQLLSRGKP